MMGMTIGIGIGIRRPYGGGASPVPSEVSCYATGVWIDEGIWRMSDTWDYGEETSGTDKMN